MGKRHHRKVRMASGNVEDRLGIVNLEVDAQINESNSTKEEPKETHAKEEKPAIDMKFYAVEITDSVFMPSKIVNKTDTESVLEKFRLLQAIRSKQTHQL